MDRLRKHSVQFYISLHWTISWPPKLDGLPLDAIGKEKVELMENELEESVVLKVLQALNGEKAPTPDNFSIFFFYKYWEILNAQFNECFLLIPFEGKKV